MTFGTPQALWFFLIVPFFVILHYMSFSDMGRFQRGLSIFLRLLLIAAMILAIADTRLIQRSDKLAVLFLVDGSHSMGEGGRAGVLDYIAEAVSESDKERDVAGVIAFGRDALVEVGLGSEWESIETIESDLEPDFTNLSGAIDLALASLPPDAGARIVVLSDGNENLGDAQTSARISANRGVEIDTIPFGEPTTGEVVAGRLILPRRVEEEEMYDVRAVIESESETDARIDVYENERLIGSQNVHLEAGKNVYAFPRQHSDGGFYAYRVNVVAEGDVEGANNIATDYTIVEGSPRICYVSGDPNEKPYVVNALHEEGIQANFVNIDGLPTSLIDMAQYDVIMFSDVGAEILMPDTMRVYQSYVRDLGCGYAMIGGTNSFGPGGYYKTPIEEMLPVDLDLTKKEYMPSIGICIAVDVSGSMGGLEAGGVQKVDIAKEACRLVVELLDYTDQIGVVAFDYAGQWVVPLTQANDKDEIIRRIGTMRAGGGTSVYAGMEPAYNALKDSDVRIRHMIVLSDGWTAGGDFRGLVDKMNVADITLTTIAVGTGSDVQFMEDLAKRGSGNFYFTNDIRTIPRIFTKETFLFSNRALVEEPFKALQNQLSSTTEGIGWGESPVLLGYVSTSIKSLATEALTTSINTDPLLAHWQYGLGRSLAFTSDAKAHWATGWLFWPGFKQVWTQSTRWLVGGSIPGNLVPNIYFRAGKAYVSVDAIDSNGEMITDAIIGARIVMPDTEVRDLDLFQVAPGRYEASLDATQIGSYLVNFFQEDSEGSMVDQVSSGFSVSFPPEYGSSGPDLFLLSQLSDITGGQLGTPSNEIFRHTNQPISRYFDLWYYLLMLAICILPIDIAVRRLSITGESIEFVRGRVSALIAAVVSRRSLYRDDFTHIDQLKKVKEKYRLTSQKEKPVESDRDVDQRIIEILARKKSEAQKPYRKSVKQVEDEKTEDGSLDRLLKAKKRVWEDDSNED